MLRLQGSSHVFLLLSVSFLTSFRLVDCGRCFCFVIRDRDGCFGLILLHAFALLAYILACFAVSNFNVLVSSRMNLELPVFDGFRCHYRLLRVQVKLISELVNGCLKEKFMFWDWSIFYSNHKQGFGNLRSLNLTSCKRPTQFPDLLKATNLEAVKPLQLC
ncbi:hypothetical protein F2Q69_00021097 [Brassica cretica]|uniref:Uncharacterized protein n=1 Tax=Brassica cretica TaxID=69181 RepID=A0A8S9QJL1_BRACR|nr:hypothetical protein F2Q69_00021097 [Brassica cretica]